MCAARIQAVARGRRVRQMVKRWNVAAVQIQRVARGRFARVRVHKIRGHIALERGARVLKVIAAAQRSPL